MTGRAAAPFVPQIADGRFWRAFHLSLHVAKRVRARTAPGPVLALSPGRSKTVPSANCSLMNFWWAKRPSCPSTTLSRRRAVDGGSLLLDLCRRTAELIEPLLVTDWQKVLRVELSYEFFYESADVNANLDLA